MNIVIIGGTRGIGKEIAILMSDSADNKVVVAGRNRNSLNELAGTSKFGNIYPAWVDLSDFDTYMIQFRDEVLGYIKVIDILINIAGTLRLRDFMETSNDDARLMMETNFFGPAAVIRLLAPRMREGSHIVNISSMGGFQGSSKYRGLSYYSASKAAIACLTECLSGEMREMGIRVNCLALGSVGTKMFEEAFPGAKASVSAKQMAGYIVDFALNGGSFFNGKILPVALNNP